MRVPGIVKWLVLGPCLIGSCATEDVSSQQIEISFETACAFKDRCPEYACELLDDEW